MALFIRHFPIDACHRVERLAILALSAAIPLRSLKVDHWRGKEFPFFSSDQIRPSTQIPLVISYLASLPPPSSPSSQFVYHRAIRRRKGPTPSISSNWLSFQSIHHPHLEASDEFIIAAQVFHFFSNQYQIQPWDYRSVRCHFELVFLYLVEL